MSADGDVFEFIGIVLLDKGVVDGGNGTVGVRLVDDDADLDLAGGDHVDVDVLAADGLEHAGSHARVALHACADNADLRAVLVDLDLAAAKTALVLLQKRERAFGVVKRDGEDQVLGAVGAGALQNDIHVDVALREQAEHLEGHAGHIRHPQDRDDCDVVVLGDAL